MHELIEPGPRATMSSLKNQRYTRIIMQCLVKSGDMSAGTNLGSNVPVVQHRRLPALARRNRVTGFILLLVMSMLCLRAESAPSDIRIEVGDPVLVEVWNRPLAELRAHIGPMSPQERAETIRERIEDIPNGSLNARITIVPTSIAGEPAAQLWLGNHLVLSLLAQDRDPELHTTLKEFASACATNLGVIIQARLRQATITVFAQGVLFSTLATVAFALALRLLDRLRRVALRRLYALAKTKELPFLKAGTRPVLYTLARGFVRGAIMIVTAAAAYLWLVFVFLQFPYSEPWGVHLGENLLSLFENLAENVQAAIPGLFAVLVILFATRLLTRAVAGLFSALENGYYDTEGIDPQVARATRVLISLGIWVLGITTAYPYIPGSDTGIFKGITVFLGLMISIGSTGFVNQVMANLVIVFSRALHPGDYVRVGETEGTVSHVGTLSTKITTPLGVETTVPNVVMISSQMTNYSQLASESGVLVTVQLGIGYDTPWRQVFELLETAAARTSGIRSDPPPSVVVKALGDFYIEYELRARLERTETRARTMSSLHTNILDAFNEHEVQIMSPHFKAQPEAKVFVPRDGWRDAPPATGTADPGGGDGGNS